MVVVVETAVDASVVEVQASTRLSATHTSPTASAGFNLPGDRFATCPGCGSGSTSRTQWPNLCPCGRRLFGFAVGLISLALREALEGRIVHVGSLTGAWV